MDYDLVPPEAVGFATVDMFWTTRAVWLACRLKLFDAIGDRPATATTLATATATRVDLLTRLLNLLVAARLLDHEAGAYRLRPAAQALRADHPMSQRAFIDSVIGGEHFEAWGETLETTLRQGGVAFVHQHGIDWVGYFHAHPERGRLFGEAMTATTHVFEEVVMAAHDFGEFSLAVDVGGSHGTLMGRLLESAPAARGIVFDLPEAIEVGRAMWAGRPYAQRIEGVGGDFFQGVPADGDLYTLKFILHDWTDEQAVAILRSVRRAILPGGRVAIIETLLPDTVQPHPGYGMDFNMLAMTGGRERSAAEFSQLLAAAGFALTRVTPTETMLGVVEGVPV